MAPKIKGWPPAIVTPVNAQELKRSEGPDVTAFIETLCNQVKDSVGGRAGEPTGFDFRETRTRAGGLRRGDRGHTRAPCSLRS